MQSAGDKKRKRLESSILGSSLPRAKVARRSSTLPPPLQPKFKRPAPPTHPRTKRPRENDSESQLHAATHARTSSASTSSTTSHRQLKRPRDDGALTTRKRARTDSADAMPITGEPNGLSMERFALETLVTDIDEASVKFRQRRVHKPWEYGVLGDATSFESEGERRVKSMRRALAYLDTQGFKRSKQQKVMHMAFLNISFAQYYGKDIQRHLLRLLRETGFSELRSECMVLAPRRYGKTISCSLWTGAELVTQPNHDVLIYSNNHRASKMMLLQTYRVVRLLQRNSDFGGAVTGLNKNESLTYRTKDGFVNELKAFPANPENLRGTGSTRPTGTVILEEMAYIPIDLVLEIVAPTLTRKNVKLIGITTVSGADSFIGPMASAKFPDGRSVFLTLNFELVCSECKRKGTPETCKCLEGDIPHWQSSSQHEKLALIMKGKIETFMKEIKGFSMDETISPAFESSAVEFLRTPEAVMPTSELYSPEIFLAVDPACGGKYSKFAIMSAIFINNHMIVTGVDSVTNTPLERQYEAIVAHINMVRSLPGLSKSRVIFCPESNLGAEGVRLTDDLIRARCEDVVVLREDGGNPGFRTDERNKKQMWVAMSSVLNDHRMRFHPHMVVANRKQGHDPHSMRDLVVSELRSYKRQLIYAKKDPHKLPKEIFTGKIGGSCDDHAIVTQLLYISRNIYLSKAQFYRRSDPIYVRGMEHGMIHHRQTPGR